MKVRRANVVLTVSENELNKYLARGYDILDDSGKVAISPVPNDVNKLQKAFIKHEAEIKALKGTIAQLESQLNEKSENDEKPKRTRKKTEES